MLHPSQTARLFRVAELAGLGDDCPSHESTRVERHSLCLQSSTLHSGSCREPQSLAIHGERIDSLCYSDPPVNLVAGGTCTCAIEETESIKTRESVMYMSTCMRDGSSLANNRLSQDPHDTDVIVRWRLNDDHFCGKNTRMYVKRHVVRTVPSPCSTRFMKRSGIHRA